MIGKRASRLVDIVYGDVIATLKKCGGYYECPRATDGKRLGPLVGYAGKYQDDSGQMKQYVGDVYYNFAKAEEYPHVLDYFGRILSHLVQEEFDFVDYVLGAPMGGIAIAKDLSRHLDCRFVFAEKKVTAVATKESKEQSRLVLNRHEIEKGATVLIVEDVCNNFSTTKELFDLITGADANLIGIACELNRSPQIEWEIYPVVALKHIPTAQYRQDDPVVSEDIAKGNVVWKPKDGWIKLIAAMEVA